MVLEGSRSLIMTHDSVLVVVLVVLLLARGLQPLGFLALLLQDGVELLLSLLHQVLLRLLLRLVLLLLLGTLGPLLQLHFSVS